MAAQRTMRVIWPLVALACATVSAANAQGLLAQARPAAAAFVSASSSPADDSPLTAGTPVTESEDGPQGTASPTPQTTQPASLPALQNSIAAGDSPDEPVRQLVNWNEYRGPYITVRFGLGLLLDYSGFIQNEASKEQVNAQPAGALRDFRFLLNGTLPEFKRPVTWCTGIMYDGPSHSWVFRQTGVQVQISENWGYIFVGRQKEGFSLNKVMVGYDGWGMERAPINDATIPILADGIKWLGYSPKYGFMWNVGYYNDILSRTQTFSTYANQQVARLAWLPIHTEQTVLHLGVNLRYGVPKGHQLQLRSRPEDFPAPYFVDTGKFQAISTHMEGYEAYYREGPWLLGSEYWWVNIDSPITGNPTVKGGDFNVAWVLTGESRPYNTVGGFFKAVSPKKPVFQGGPGAWELVLHYSTINLNSQSIHGGTFDRFTPMMNWYLSDSVRLEFNYGYGRLNRFGLIGDTQFFQTRLQLQL